MRNVVLLIGLFLGTLNLNPSCAAAAGVVGGPRLEAQTNMIFVLNAALYEAIENSASSQNAAQLVRDMIFAKVRLPFNTFERADIRQISRPQRPDYAYVVASACLLAFAFPRDDFWTDLKDTLSTHQGTP